MDIHAMPWNQKKTCRSLKLHRAWSWCWLNSVISRSWWEVAIPAEPSCQPLFSVSPVYVGCFVFRATIALAFTGSCSEWHCLGNLKAVSMRDGTSFFLRLFTHRHCCVSSYCDLLLPKVSYLQVCLYLSDLREFKAKVVCRLSQVLRVFWVCFTFGVA